MVTNFKDKAGNTDGGGIVQNLKWGGGGGFRIFFSDASQSLDMYELLTH